MCMVNFSLARSSIYGFWFASKSNQIYQEMKIVLNGARKERFICECSRTFVKKKLNSIFGIVGPDGQPDSNTFPFQC